MLLRSVALGIGLAACTACKPSLESGVADTTDSSDSAESGGLGSDTGSDGDLDGDSTDLTETTGADGECGLAGLEDPGPVALAPGDPVYHFTALAHTGEVINICRFAGKRLMLDLSTVWCGPCHIVADCVAGNDSACGMFFEGDYQEVLNGVRENLVAERTNWVTILAQDQSGGPPDLSDIQGWAEDYPQSNVWVLTDVAGDFQHWFPTMGVPYFTSVEDDFTYLNGENGPFWDLAVP